jgi:hypothetical protein
MPYRRSWLPVDYHAGVGGGEQDGQPIQEAVPKTVVPQNLKEKGSGQRVESAGEVQLNEDARFSQLVKEAGGLSHQDKFEIICGLKSCVLFSWVGSWT